MLIFIRALAGTVIRLNVSPCETVQMVKTRISQLRGIPVSQQHLIFDGVELSNGTLLVAAQISHGALLRLVLGVQSGPLSREMVHGPGTAQPYHRLSSARQAICSPTVPVAPIHRIPASTVVLPVLCTPTRIPSGHQHPHYKHPYHPQLQYLASHVAAYPPNQPAFYRPSNEWDEQDSFIPAEFAMDEETLGSNDDTASELAEYLGYAIDEDELNFEQTDVSTIRSASVPESIAEGVDEQADRIGSAATSECRFVPVYPIPSHLHWIVNPADLDQLTDSQSCAADDHADGSAHPPESMTTPVTRFAPVPVAYGIPVPLATSKSDHHSRLATPDPSGSTVTPTSSHPDSRTTLDPSVVSPMAFALPTQLRSAQLANLVSDLGWPVTSTGSFVPTATTATAAAPATTTTATSTTGLIIPPFALFPIRHLSPEAVGAAADPEFVSKMHKDSDLSTTTHSSDPNSMRHKSSSPLAQESNPTVHSNPAHIPETKERFPSAIQQSAALPGAISDMRSTQPVTQTHCFHCQRRTRPAQGFSCRCQKWFCQKHYHPEDHNCAFDFKTMSLGAPCTTPASPPPSSQPTGVGDAESGSNRQ